MKEMIKDGLEAVAIIGEDEGYLFCYKQISKHELVHKRYSSTS